MGGEWPTVAFGQKAEKIGSGATPRGGKYAYLPNGPFALIRSQNVLDLAFSRKGLAHIDESQASALSNVEVRPGDVLINITGDSVARVCMVDPEILPARVNQHVSILRAQTSAFDQRYLLYALVHPSMKQRLLGLASAGATRNALTKGDLERLQIAQPPLHEQRRIGELLGSLDDKIELNRRKAETLEAIARALFKSWFEGGGEIGSVVVQTLIDNGVLQIGDGYRAKNDELVAPGLPFIRAADLNGAIDTATADTLSKASVSKAGSKVSRPGDVAFTSKGTVGRFARVDDRTPEFVYSPQVCFWRSLDAARLHPALLYLLMRSPAFLAQIDTAAGQTDMAPYVSLQDQRRMIVPALSPDQASFGEQVQAFLSQRAALAEESRTLAELRDTLLPKLISGELRIADAEAQVSAA